MTVSSYQILRLVTRVLREGAADREPEASRPPAPSFDRVELSIRAREQAAEAALSLRLPPGAAVRVATIVDTVELPIATRSELERRAGSFMHPPQPPNPASPPIPRARRPFPTSGESEPLYDEDFEGAADSVPKE